MTRPAATEVGSGGSGGSGGSQHSTRLRDSDNLLALQSVLFIIDSGQMPRGTAAN